MKLDKSGFSFTKGIGMNLPSADDPDYFNQCFGNPAFAKFLEDEQPSEKDLDHCRHVVMHHLGYVFGLKPELRPIEGVDTTEIQRFYRRALIHFDHNELAKKDFSEIIAEAKKYSDYIAKKSMTNFEKFNPDSIMSYSMPK